MTIQHLADAFRTGGFVPLAENVLIVHVFQIIVSYPVPNLASWKTSQRFGIPSGEASHFEVNLEH